MQQVFYGVYCPTHKGVLTSYNELQSIINNDKNKKYCRFQKFETDEEATDWVKSLNIIQDSTFKSVLDDEPATKKRKDRPSSGESEKLAPPTAPQKKTSSRIAALKRSDATFAKPQRVAPQKVVNGEVVRNE